MSSTLSAQLLGPAQQTQTLAERDVDNLFRAIHQFGALPPSQVTEAQTQSFLGTVGGLSTLFAVAALVEDAQTQSLVFRTIDRVLTPALVQSLLDTEEQREQVLAMMSAGLAHHSLPLRLFVLQQLTKNITLFQSTILAPHSPLLVAIMRLLCETDSDSDSDAAVQAPITAMMTAIVQISSNNLQFLFHPATIQSCLSLASVDWPTTDTDTGDDRKLDNESERLSSSQVTILLRLLSLYVDIATINDTALTHLQSSGLYQFLLSALTRASNDLLYQLNLIELCDKLIQRLPRIDSAIVQSLFQSLFALQLSSFTSVAVLHVIESLCDTCVRLCYDRHWQSSPSLLSFLTSALSDEDSESVLNQAFVTLASLASMNFDSLVLYAPLVLKYLPQYVSSTAELLQLSAIHGLTKVFTATHIDTDSDTGNDRARMSLYETMFDAIGTCSNTYKGRDSMTIIRALLSQPFHDIRFALLRMLVSLSSLPSRHLAESLISNGMIEWLLDRQTETEVTGMRLKHDIIAALSRNTAIVGGGLVDSAVVTQLSGYVREGPVYVAREAAVLPPVSKAG